MLSDDGDDLVEHLGEAQNGVMGVRGALQSGIEVDLAKAEVFRNPVQPHVVSVAVAGGEIGGRRGASFVNPVVEGEAAAVGGEWSFAPGVARDPKGSKEILRQGDAHPACTAHQGVLGKAEEGCEENFRGAAPEGFSPEPVLGLGQRAGGVLKPGGFIFRPGEVGLEIGGVGGTWSRGADEDGTFVRKNSQRHTQDSACLEVKAGVGAQPRKVEGGRSGDAEVGVHVDKEIGPSGRILLENRWLWMSGLRWLRR